MKSKYDLTRFTSNDFQTPFGGEFMSAWDLYLFDHNLEPTMSSVLKRGFEELQHQTWHIEYNLKQLELIRKGVI